MALLTGLPASGKSTVAKWLTASCQDDTASITHIEYDQVEDGLLEASGAKNEEHGSDSHTSEFGSRASKNR